MPKNNQPKEQGKIILGDCLEVMRGMANNSVDCVVTDPPYGITAIEWDTVPDLGKMWDEFKRVGKPNCIYLFTTAQPFTTDLINSNRNWFRYEWIYEKTNPRGFQSAKYKPLTTHENILVFSAKSPRYYPQMWECPPQYVNKRKSFTLRENAAAYGGKLIPRKQESTIKYPRSVIPVSNHTPRSGLFHPTQKPVSLMAYLIKTYSVTGDTVFDPFAGSGSTLVAAKQLGRSFIGIEINPDYVKIAEERLKQEVLMMPKNTPKKKVPRNERLDNLKPPYDGMNEDTRRKLTDNTLDNQQLQCTNCKKLTIKVEAETRNFNTGFCRYCGGSLEPFDNTLDKEFDSLVDLLRETDTPVGKMYGVVPKQNIEKARAKFKSLIADDRKKMPEFVIPKKITSNVEFDPARNRIVKIYKDGMAARAYNLAIDDMSQRAKEWSKK